MLVWTFEMRATLRVRPSATRASRFWLISWISTPFCSKIPCTSLNLCCSTCTTFPPPLSLSPPPLLSVPPTPPPPPLLVTTTTSPQPPLLMTLSSSIIPRSTQISRSLLRLKKEFDLTRKIWGGYGVLVLYGQIKNIPNGGEAGRVETECTSEESKI